MGLISENYKKIKDKIGSKKVKALAVTKYVGTSEVIEAYEAGIRDFAENKAQDALNKRKDLPEEIEKNSIWHFIGHLQTNKIKYVVGNFDYIHSVDSLKLAKAISDKAIQLGIKQKILIQVNIAEETSKFGYTKETIKEEFKKLIGLEGVKIEGLMLIAPFNENFEDLQKIFKSLRELKDFLQETYNYPLQELSMGMSNDYEIAIQEGSTMIRVGRILFY